jgi:glycosyltransferase involved in cell wall biosynthesis
LRILINHLSQEQGRTTGFTVYTFELLEALLEHGDFEYALATTWSRESLPEKLRTGLGQVITKPYVKSAVLNFLSQLIDGPKLARQANADVILNATPVGAIVGAKTRITIIHDLYRDRFPGLYSLQTRGLWRLLLSLIVRRSKILLCVSQTTRDDLERFYPSARGKTAIAHAASPLAAEECGGVPEWSIRKPFVLFVANIVPTKNVGILIEAMDRLRQRDRLIDCIHVGRDDHGILRTALARYPNLFGWKSVGTVDEQSLRWYYRSSACVVVPSLYEGFSMPALEAQNLGAPLIASDIPALREVAGDGALFFPADDPEHLARLILTVIDDGAEAARLVRAGSDNSAHFSWARTAREVERAVSTALE